MKINRFKLKKALAEFDALGIEIGDVVTVTWEVDAAYAVEGSRTRSHTGPLKSFDREHGWFEVSPSNRSPGHFRSSILTAGLKFEKTPEHAVRTPPWELESDEDQPKPTKPNPFVAKAKKNPFIEKAKS